MRRLLVVLLVVVFLSGCIASGTTPSGSSHGTSPSSSGGSSIPSMTKYDVLKEGQERPIVEGLNTFTFELYKRLSTEKGNIFFSPYSLYTALAMTYEGARGSTREEIEKALHLPEEEETRWTGFRYLILSLNSSKAPYVLSTANALWIQEGYPIKERYIWIIRGFYKGELRSADFMGNPDEAVDEINRWAEEKTRGRIKNLLSKGSLSGSTRLVIANALYLKANWSSRFDPSETHNGTFTTPDGEAVVPMMHQRGRFNYTETPDLQAIEMPYEGKRLSMIIILPKGNLSAVESKLTPEFIRELRDGMKLELVDVTIPKFKFEKSYSLKRALVEMGMEKAFSSGADFRGISGAEGLFIGDVLHKSFISVGENGTEAAAATAVVVFGSGQPGEEEYRVFKADHPFLFLIVDNETGAILFIGRLVDPRG